MHFHRFRAGASTKNLLRRTAPFHGPSKNHGILGRRSGRTDAEPPRWTGRRCVPAGLAMHPIAFQFEVAGIPRTIGSYGILLAIALLVGAFVATRAAARAKLDWGAAIAVLGFTVAAGGLGASTLFALVEWGRTGDPLQGIRQPGLVFFGAPFGGGLAFVWSARRLGLPALRFVDEAIVALPLAHAVGRLGCFLGGCCFGAPHDGWLSVTYTHLLAPAAYPPVPRHPAPLYESVGLLAIGLALALLPKRAMGTGQRLFLYMALYGALRFVVELFRGDSVRGLYLDGALSTSQLIALWVLAAGTAGLLLRPSVTRAPSPSG
ncbi:MAG: prolipoprotein diacylglyceryl transferase family protein [Myxococcota bacterium]